MKKVFCIGEVLIDFICCNNAPLNEGKYFEKAGGAPANVAVSITKLGGKSSLWDKLVMILLADFLKNITRK